MECAGFAQGDRVSGIIIPAACAAMASGLRIRAMPVSRNARTFVVAKSVMPKNLETTGDAEIVESARGKFPPENALRIAG